MYEGHNLRELHPRLRNNNSINDTDMVGLVPYDESFPKPEAKKMRT